MATGGLEATFSALTTCAGDVLLSVRSTTEDYQGPRDGTEGTATEDMNRWGDQSLSPAELRARLVAAYPHASNDPAVPWAWFPGLLMCRPAAFSPEEELELGFCSKTYQVVHNFFSPGTFTICCACDHSKMLGFVVLDKREGPPALLNALLSRFALLPHYFVYDFACGALRSAIGRLPFVVALVVLKSDLFHIASHLCIDALHPRSDEALDKDNTVAHEQRNTPINLLPRTLRSVCQHDYMGVLKMENVVYNLMACAKASCVYPLPENYHYRQYHISRTLCSCGCAHHPEALLKPPPPPGAPEQLNTYDYVKVSWAVVDLEPLNVLLLATAKIAPLSQ